MPHTDHHALVFGATGLAASTFYSPASQPPATNRLVDGPDTYWPDGEPSDLRIVCELNCDTMQRVVGAVKKLAPRLKSIVCSGGTRGYGINVPNGTLTAPLKESMADNLPADYAKTVASPWFRQFLTEASTGRGLIRGVSRRRRGFSPIGSDFSLALHLVHCLSLYARNHGVGEFSPAMLEVPFPGNEQAYNALFMPMINMVDCTQPTTFDQLWPAVASWLSLVGVGPSADNTGKSPGDYIEEHKHVFGEKGRPKALSAGVGAGHKQLESGGWQLKFDRLRAVGFTEERSPEEGWLEAFDKFPLREYGIPSALP
ncbi:hypothetical protein BGZ61DRAFT_495199 [Ilyonectria robusta]|uniref:uncharacterized protein n=1 Tax=Ilyonectria robusta TaxID=1079257 RepID=UPI001E8E72A7|nr:uncharacterized protein BGZ61DRAFT_495199 [Ilyonectria robusta]KAH8686554.1 hypothetical protein BGZ61DRAFT_495199 [Ilyonectria robusta]